MKSESMTVLEISAKYLKVLQAVNQKGKTAVSHFIVRGLPGNETKDIAETLREVFAAEKGLSTRVQVVIPRNEFIQKIMHLPVQTDDEIRDMLKLQIPQYVPYSSEEIIFDHIILERDESGYIKVLVYICAKEVVSRILDILDAAKLDFDAINLSSIGVWNWWQGVDSLREKDSGTMLLINMEDNHSEICFFKEAKLLFSRDIFLGYSDLAQDDSSTFIKQMGLTFRSFHNDFADYEIAGIVLFENSPRVALLSDVLENYYKIPVQRIAPLGAADINFVGEEQHGLQGTTEVSQVEMLGFAMDEKVKALNFVPMDVVVSKQAVVLRKSLLKTGLLLLVAAVLGGSILFADIFYKQKYCDDVQRELSQYKKEMKEAERKIAFMRFVEALAKNKVFIADMIKELFEITPENVSFRSLDINAKGRFFIEGYAFEGVDVNNFQNNLVASEMFSDVNLQYATKRKRLRKEYTEFKISCQIMR